ncbi:MAG TPA: MFS transporter, partial [Blastocatellia bacterium]
EKTLTLSAILFVICLLLLNIAGVVVSPALAYAFTIFYGISFGMATPALITSASDLFQGKRRGSILGAIVLGGYVGGAVGAWLSGRFFDLTGAYEINFLAAGLAMLTSAWLIWKANPDAVRHAQHRLS